MGEAICTNPAELMASAHSGCFRMKIVYVLAGAVFTPDNIDTRCDITLESGTITQSHLTVKASVPGITAEKFQEAVMEAKANCPVSKLLKCEISAEASLEQVTA